MGIHQRYPPSVPNLCNSVDSAAFHSALTTDAPADACVKKASLQTVLIQLNDAYRMTVTKAVDMSPLS